MSSPLRACFLGAVLASGGCTLLERTPDAPAPEAMPDTGSDAVPDERPEPAIDPQSDRQGVLDNVGNFVERAQADATRRFDAFIFEVDDFFAGDLKSDEPNRSFLRLRVDAAKPALEDFKLDPSLKLRIVLPRAQQRFRLLLSTEDEPGTGESDVQRVSAIVNDDDSVSFALRFVRSARRSSEIDYDIGVRQRDGDVQPFGRIKAVYRNDLSERWQLRLDNRYVYYSKSGFEDRLRFDLTRPIGRREGRFFRASTTADWRKGQRGATLGQTLGLYVEIDARAAIAIETLGIYDTALNGEQRVRYRGHELRVRYRRNVWRPWLFYEVWPAIAWPAERDYRRTWTALARLEVLVGGELGRMSRIPDAVDVPPDAPVESGEP